MTYRALRDTGQTYKAPSIAHIVCGGSSPSPQAVTYPAGRSLGIKIYKQQTRGGRTVTSLTYFASFQYSERNWIRKTLHIISHMGRSDVLKRGFQYTILYHSGHVSKRLANRTLALARVPAGGRCYDYRLEGRQRIKGSSEGVGELQAGAWCAR